MGFGVFTCIWVRTTVYEIQWYAPIKIIGIKIIVPIKSEKSLIKIDGSYF
jgi:hypothetical protein